MSELPIDSVLPQLLETFRQNNNAALVAPPGAGKTTQVAPALLHEPWLADRRIIMLEPRRLAAKSAAIWMAQQMGEKAGETVGYRMRMDSKISNKTRIEVVTEGILTRILQNDPGLDEYGMVIFDEFHERSLHADLGLALCIEIQQSLREDLRLLVMSATLDVEPVAKLLGDAPVVRSEGRSFPVTINYAQSKTEMSLENNIGRQVMHALQHDPGSILIFLPGQREIQRVNELLLEKIQDPEISIHPLYANLSQEEQQQAIRPAQHGKRKIVLATSIAETSLTIEGIRVVIDSGLMRVPRFKPGTGMTRLETVNVSIASSEQRCGRAGRTQAGVCYRLWSKDRQNSLLPYHMAEIQQADLTPLALELAQWGIQDPSLLHWLTPPPPAAYAQAQSLLKQLEALDEQSRMTQHGRRMLELGVHPRLSHMILKAGDMEQARLACDIAALLGERDFLRLRQDERDTDIRLRIDVMNNTGIQDAYSVNRSALQRVKHSSQELQRRIKSSRQNIDIEYTGILLALAYPDRIGRLRQTSTGNFILSNGKGAIINDLDKLANAEFIVAAELDGDNRQARIFLAVPIRLDELKKHFSTFIKEKTIIKWDADKKAVSAKTQQQLGNLVLDDVPAVLTNNEKQIQVMLEGIRKEGLDALPWQKEQRNWQQRVLFLRHTNNDEQWPDVCDDTLLATLEVWLKPYLINMTRISQLNELNLGAILTGQINWQQQQSLDQLAPTHIKVPSGSRVPIDYTSVERPVLAVRLQELFGLTDTPRIADGKAALLLHLLSPARRPIQVTQDLGSFWKNTYQQVKKDLKGRYPKHYWPDDPLQARPTSRAKPRK